MGVSYIIIANSGYEKPQMKYMNLMKAHCKNGFFPQVSRLKNLKVPM
jgi:hypothetical protein